MYLPLPAENVLLHPLLGQLLSLHGIGVLLQPGVFYTAGTGQTGPRGRLGVRA